MKDGLGSGKMERKAPTLRNLKDQPLPEPRMAEPLSISDFVFGGVLSRRTSQGRNLRVEPRRSRTTRYSCQSAQFRLWEAEQWWGWRVRHSKSPIHGYWRHRCF